MIYKFIKDFLNLNITIINNISIINDVNLYFTSKYHIFVKRI